MRIATLSAHSIWCDVCAHFTFHRVRVIFDQSGRTGNCDILKLIDLLWLPNIKLWTGPDLKMVFQNSFHTLTPWLL